LSVDPDTVPTSDALAWSDQLAYPKVRRWDQSETDDIELADGAVPITEASEGSPNWISLEDGVQVQFAAGGTYRSDDYWLIPARVATGIEWPVVEDEAGNTVQELCPPRGIEHHYAPLGFFAWRGETWKIKSCRCDFEPLSSCFGMGSIAVGAHLIKGQFGGKVSEAPDRVAVAKPLALQPQKATKVAVRRKKRNS
jgi:Family of unknown function (DUF6519)